MNTKQQKNHKRTQKKHRSLPEKFQQQSKVTTKTTRPISAKNKGKLSTINFKQSLTSSLMNLRNEKEEYSLDTVLKWNSKEDRQLVLEERFGSSLKLTFTAKELEFFSIQIRKSDIQSLKIVKSICNYIEHMEGITLKYDTYQLAWLFFKKQNRYSLLLNETFKSIINDLEITCWQNNRQDLIDSITKFYQFEQLQKLTIDLSMMCTSDDEDQAFLEQLLETLNKHIDDIKTLKFFKITIKILTKDGKLFNESSQLFEFIKKIHQKSQNEKEFKAFIQHQKLEKNQESKNVILQFPIQNKRWTDLQKQLKNNELTSFI